jgi:hypothetical protein
MKDDKGLRTELINFLNGSFTHKSIFDAVKGVPENLFNAKPNNVPYSPWQLLEHIRISQYDMVDFIRNPEYKELEWPKEYWPGSEIKATKAMWDDTLSQIKRDLKSLENIIRDPSVDLLAPIPHGKGQTILKEVLQIIDHAAYHTGILILMRRALKVWND